MSSDPIGEQLERAYKLIRAGDKAAALKVLKPICKAHPQNEKAWWLAANAFAEPDQVKMALQKVLLIDPFHKQAQRRLDQLQTESPPPSPMRPTQAVPATPQRRSGWFLMLIVGVIVIGVIVVAAVLFTRSDDAPSSAEIDVSTTVSLVATHTPTITLTATPITPTSTLTPIPTRTALPATWTPSPTWTPDLTRAALPTVDILFDRPTATPYFVQAIETADPARFGDTYWEGDGDGVTMDTNRTVDGRYFRFFEFPIRVYVTGAVTDDWEDAAIHAINQVNQVVPMILVNDPSNVQVLVTILTADEYFAVTGCGADSLGCAELNDLGSASILATAPNPRTTFLHELLHAIGVAAHSPNGEDIMYFRIIDRSTMSQRDINTLRRLYANPSYAD